MQYPAFAAFVAPARAYPQIWRLLLGLILAGLIITATFFGILAVAMFSGAPDLIADMAAWSQTLEATPSPLERQASRWMSGETPTATLVLLATFVGFFLAPIAVAKLLHKRGLATLLGDTGVVVRHFAIAAVIAAGLVALSAAVPPYLDLLPGLDLGLWFSFLPLALVLILIQTGAEELLFRGYIQQQLAARFSSPLVWMVLPAALFALGHYDPAHYGDHAWTIVAATGLFAIFAADLTARTGSIGAAWGFHFANNVAAILFVSLEGPLGGLSIYLLPQSALSGDTLTIALVRDIATTAIIWMAIRVALGVRPPQPDPTAL